MPSPKLTLAEGVYQRSSDSVDQPLSLSGLNKADLGAAAAMIERILGSTPTLQAPKLSKRWDRSVYVKYENISPVRSFKARGGLAAISDLVSNKDSSGVTTASTGNHGQGLAFAGGEFEVPVEIVVPENAEQAKVDALKDLGATLKIHGKNLSEAQIYAAKLAARNGAVFIEDGDHLGLMKGAASVLSEMVRQAPDLETIIVPVGGGNLISGALIAASYAAPHLTIVGVQSSAAPGATNSWIAGETATAECRTFAGGLATEYPGAASLKVMNALLETMILVSDADLWKGIATVFDTTGAAVEGAAAAGVAAMDRFGSEIPGNTIGILLTGGWINRNDLLRSIDTSRA